MKRWTTEQRLAYGRAFIAQHEKGWTLKQIAAASRCDVH